jgi:cytochrome P450
LNARLRETWVNLAAHPVAWPAAQVLRTLGPVVRVPGLGVVINDLELAHEILGRDDAFTKNGEGSIAAVFTQAMGPFALANMDGHAHHQLRSRLGDLLTPARCAALLDACRAPLDDACARLAGGETVDLVAVTRVFSGRLTMEMMGIAPEDEDRNAAALRVFVLGERIAAALQLHPLTGSRLESVRGDLDRLTGYARAAFENPDLAPGSLVYRLREMGLNGEEARGVLSIFFVAGTLTAAVALPRVIALLVDSGNLEAIRDDTTLTAKAVDECLRLTTPVPATVRITAKDSEVRGHRFRRGTRVVLLTANMARDPAVFPRAGELDIHRTFDARGRYLWYGAGPHFCLGFPLAQREMHLVVGELARLPGHLRIARRRAATGVLLPAYARLELRLDP